MQHAPPPAAHQPGRAAEKDRRNHRCAELASRASMHTQGPANGFTSFLPPVLFCRSFELQSIEKMSWIVQAWGGRGLWPAAVPARLPLCHELSPTQLPPFNHAAAGTAFLDQLRASFLARMERVKGELTTMVDDAGGCCAMPGLQHSPVALLGMLWSMGRVQACYYQSCVPSILNCPTQHAPSLLARLARPPAEEALRLQSASTLDCCRRADLTAGLIAKLGIKTADVEQQRPDTIESMQEEGEAPGVDAAGPAQ